MRTAWEILTAGTADAAHGVLLLPGGAMAARSYNRVMAEPALEGTHLIAATLPYGRRSDRRRHGHHRTGASRRRSRRRTPVRRSSWLPIGATIALEMVLSTSFSGPLVLLGPIGGLGHLPASTTAADGRGDGSVRPGRDARGHCRSGHWLAAWFSSCSFSRRRGSASGGRAHGPEAQA